MNETVTVHLTTAHAVPAGSVQASTAFSISATEKVIVSQSPAEPRPWDDSFCAEGMLIVSCAPADHQSPERVG